jgi:hypothetical protein
MVPRPDRPLQTWKTFVRHSRARCSGSVASRHRRSSADCITTTCESEFSAHTRPACTLAILPISGGRACRAGGPSRLLIRGVESHARHGLDPDKVIFYVLDACHVLSSNAPRPSLLLRFVNRFAVFENGA